MFDRFASYSDFNLFKMTVMSLFKIQDIEDRSLDLSRMSGNSDYRTFRDTTEKPDNCSTTASADISIVPPTVISVDTLIDIKIKYIVYS